MYERTIGDETLTFAVSGKLWNRSLVMMDTETESLWSHLLGRCVEGELKDTRLVVLPSDMVTWAAWRAEHPETTVLDLSRTNREFTRDFYERPERFVIGIVMGARTFHVSFPTLMQRPALNVTLRDRPLLISFDEESTSFRIYDRRVDDQILHFELSGKGRLRDRETGSEWNRASGTAVGGNLAESELAEQVGIISFARAWQTFHPESEEITAE